MLIRFKTSDGSIFDSREEAYEHNKGDPIEIVYNAGIDGAIYPSLEALNTPLQPRRSFPTKY